MSESHFNQDLISSAGGGDLPLVRLLLEKQVDVNTQNSEGYTALMRAATFGNLDVVKFLLDTKQI